MLIAKSQAVQLITNEDVAANREGTIYPAVLQAKVERVALKHYFLAQIWYAVGGNGIEDSFKDRPGDITVRFPYLTTTSPGTKNTIARARFQANRWMAKYVDRFTHAPVITTYGPVANRDTLLMVALRQAICHDPADPTPSDP